MKAAHTALEIARFLLWRVAQERPEEPAFLTPMQLQKLLYYVQGWHLVDAGQPAFADEIRAWQNGPVVVAVYREFQDWKSLPITEHPDEPPDLTPDTRAIVESVWSRYRDYSAFKLSDMTHDEMPWKKARGTLAKSAKSDKQIPLSDIRREFVEQSEQAQSKLRSHARQIRQAARDQTRRVAPWVYDRKLGGA